MNTKLIILMESVRSFFKREEGASAIEYALIAGLIAVAIIGVAGLLGTELKSLFQSILTALEGAKTAQSTPPAG